MGIPDNCIGRFYGKPAPIPKVESECSLLDLGFPAECYVYTSIDILNLNAYVDAAKFKEDFCDGYCGKYVNNYFVKQDMVTGGNNASYVDFLCSENSSGEVCTSIISDSDLQDYFDNECDDVPTHIVLKNAVVSFKSSFRSGVAVFLLLGPWITMLPSLKVSYRSVIWRVTQRCAQEGCQGSLLQLLGR